MRQSNVARDGKVYVMSEKCKTCIFRRGNLMQLSPGRVKGMVDECLKHDAQITCHETLGTPRRNAVCRGFYDRYADRVWPLRTARGLGFVVFQEVEK